MTDYLGLTPTYIDSSTLQHPKKKNVKTRENVSGILRGNLTDSIDRLPEEYMTSLLLSEDYIQKVLSEKFSFDADCISILKFLSNKNISIEFLNSVYAYILYDKNFNFNRIALDLLDEGENWKTLFFNVYTNEGWVESNNLKENFLNNLLQNFPDKFEFINISVIHDSI